jgi:hypothetical protein
MTFTDVSGFRWRRHHIRPDQLAGFTFSWWNLLSATHVRMSPRRNQIARPHRSGGLPAVNTICSSVRMHRTSCGMISGRGASCFDSVRDEPDIRAVRLNWSTSTVVLPQRREI